MEIIPKKAHPFSVLCWVRSPASTVDKFDELGNILGYLETFNRKIILLGDTYRNSLSVESGIASTAEHMQNIYLDKSVNWGLRLKNEGRSGPKGLCFQNEELCNFCRLNVKVLLPVPFH